MDKDLICIDTSILIEYYRKKNKERSHLVLLEKSYDFCISVITMLEILVGTNPENKDFWSDFFSKITVLSLNEAEVEKASEIIRDLKKQNKVIGIQDVLIASTAIVNRVKLATLNKKHFSRISDLSLVK